LLKLNFRGQLTAFADDLGIIYKEKSLLNIQASINYDLHIIRNWFTNHKMVISDKTKIMYFSLSPQSDFEVPVCYHAPDCLRFKIDNECGHSNTARPVCYDEIIMCSAYCFTIEIVFEFKYLGVIIDYRMNWFPHTESIRIYLNYGLQCLYYLKKICFEIILLNFYYAIVQSKLQYGLTCYGGTNENKILPLLRSQKRFIRTICNKPRRHPSFELFKKLSVLPLRHLYCFKVLKVFFIRS
jgi:hypothetical protein